MDGDNIAVTDEVRESRRVSRRALIQQAVALAMQSKWEEAAELNQRIVEMSPDDSETYNRLGKAYRELGRIADSRGAYEEAVRRDPANAIALRSLEALSHITDSEAAELTRSTGEKLDPRFFMEETGKTGVTLLQHSAPPEVLATLSAGDRVSLEAHSGKLLVIAVHGVQIGEVESGLATRLTRLMQTGNEYQAGVVGADGNSVRIIIREIVQSPRNSGRISFPPRTETLPRPYLREGLIRRGSEDEEDEELEGETREEGGDDDEEDSSEFGFHEGPLDES